MAFRAVRDICKSLTEIHNLSIKQYWFIKKINFIIRITNQIWWYSKDYFSALIIVADLDLLICERDNFTFALLYWVIQNQNKFVTVSLQNSHGPLWRIQNSFCHSSINEKQCLSLALSRFAVKSVYCVPSRSESSSYCQLKCITIN